MINSITLTDLAKRLNLNKSSVSLALRNSPKVSDATRRRVQETAAQMGYRPNLAARQLSSASPQVLALVLPTNLSTLASAAAVASIQSLACHAASAGLVFTMLTVDDLLKAAQGRTSPPLLPDGLWIWGDVPTHLVGVIETLGRPVVILDPNDASYASYPGVAVSVDNAGGAEALVKHLMAHGANRLLFVQGIRNHLGHEQRMVGARRAWLARRSLEQFSVCFLDELTDKNLAAFARSSHGAIFCSNDFCALQVWHRLQQRKLRVPEDVLLVGFDGEASGRIIDLTTAVFDTAALGEAAFMLLMDRLRPKHVRHPRPVVPVQIHWGHTTQTDNASR